MINMKEPLETKRKRPPKRPSGLETATNKVISDKFKKSTSESRGAMILTRHDCIQNKSSVMERAQVVQANLAAEFPSFLKSMLPSHVAGGFWLSFPKSFCDKHLPRQDDTVTLVDESEEHYKAKYLVGKNGLSGGWRGFSIAHKLLEGDVLVFQLVQPCKFKVYIVRASGLTEIDGAIGLLTLDAGVKPMDIDLTEEDMKEGEKCSPLSLDIHQYNTVQENGIVALSTDIGLGTEPEFGSGNESDEFSSEVLEGIKFSESCVDFKDIKSIDNFTVLVDGLVIDSMIPPYLRTKYYELCCSQKAFLHNHLLSGLNCKLAAGMISETVNIADAIKASKLTTTRDNFTTWDKTLKAFEELGMNVGFLRARIDRLVSLAFDKEKVLESKRLERVKAEEEMRSLEDKLLKVKEVMKSLDEEIEGLKGNRKTVEGVFQEEANAPW
ncbi:B3 domain-containing protein Os01g0234100 [Camellia lanceoleosa]|uniref:B3 domain-containing protein Os01g0234100 n=1 Tax=Camellia lanceoleosa TaxID=1840588 RepID=A0ACC0HUN2_9ERIC|nr:B3 domain-containing protein Os01g0234100 [Camellia lanceoleosa]